MKQEYLYKVITQEQEISGPPRYLTTDWKAAKESVLKLEKLKPLTAVTGHGIPMSGELLSTSLKTLVQEFDKIAVPDYGKYIDKRCIKRGNTLFIFILTNQNMIQNQNTKNIKFNMKKLYLGNLSIIRMELPFMNKARYSANTIHSISLPLTQVVLLTIKG